MDATSRAAYLAVARHEVADAAARAAAAEAAAATARAEAAQLQSALAGVVLLYGDRLEEWLTADPILTDSHPIVGRVRQQLAQLLDRGLLAEMANTASENPAFLENFGRLHDAIVGDQWSDSDADDASDADV